MIKQRHRDIVAIILLLVSLFVLFTVPGAEILFSVLPKSEAWLRFGIYFPYFLIVISMYLLIWYRINKGNTDSDS